MALVTVSRACVKNVRMSGHWSARLLDPTAMALTSRDLTMDSMRCWISRNREPFSSEVEGSVVEGGGWALSMNVDRDLLLRLWMLEKMWNLCV